MSDEILHDPEVITDQVPLPKRDSTAVRRSEGEAERLRQTAFDSAPHWQARALQPFSVSRETLFLQLRVAAGAPPLYAAMADIEAWYPDAVRLAWLCTHAPADWQELRARPLELQAAIDQWADTAIDSRRDKADLVLLTLRLWNDSQINAHEPSPDPAGKDREPGN
jgi:hypothetical protein